MRSTGRGDAALAGLVLLVACTPPLEPGGYELTVSKDFIWESNDAHYEVSADGALLGHPSGTYYACERALSDESQRRLTDLLNAADVLDRGETSHVDCSEPTIWHFDVTGTSGEAAGLHNTFRYWLCGETRIGELDAVIAELAAQTAAVDVCETCASELEPGRCLGDDYGATRFCSGPEPQDCDAAATGELGCVWGRTLECDGARWIPATTWTLTDAVLHRWDIDGSLAYAIFYTLDVDNEASAADLLLDELGVLSQARDAQGEVVAFDPSLSSIWYVPAHTRMTVEQHVWTDESSLAIATLALRERPWDGVRFGAAVAVQFVDGPPPGW